MTSRFAATVRFTLGLLLLLAPGAWLFAGEGDESKKAESSKAESANKTESAKPKPQAFEGVVAPLAAVLKGQSTKADDDALNVSRVLKTQDGKIYTLVKDDASRKFFMDDRLLRRPMKITAVVIPESQMLIVVNAQSVVEGKLYDIDYWCEKCQLSATEPGACKCCGAQVELRELPVEP